MFNRCPHNAGRILAPLADPPRALGCADCHGLWLPGGAIERLLGGRPAPGWRRLPETALRCPHDGKALRALRYEGVEIDVCGACSGVWLDRGELVAVLDARAQRKAERIAEHESDIAHAAELLDSAIDGAVQRLGTRLGFGGDTSRPVALRLEPPAPPAARLQVERPDVPETGNAGQTEGASTAGRPSSGMSHVNADAGALDALGKLFDFIGDAFSAL